MSREYKQNLLKVVSKTERGIKLCRGHHTRGRLRGWCFRAQTPQDAVGFQLLLSPVKHKSDLLCPGGVRGGFPSRQLTRATQEGKSSCWGKKQVIAALLLHVGHQRGPHLQRSFAVYPLLRDEPQLHLVSMPMAPCREPKPRIDRAEL